METERRRVSRFKIRQLIEITFGRELFVRARGFDLSELGLRCATDVYLEPSTVVSLEITIPVGSEGRNIVCDGLVVWCEEDGSEFATGISFGPLRTEDGEALSLFLHRERAAADGSVAEASEAEEGTPPTP